MSDSLDQILGLTTFSPSIYNQLMSKWCYWADRSGADVANGYRLTHHFPLLYTDYNAANQALINIAPDLFPFPRHTLLYKNGTRMAPIPLQQGAAGERSRLLLGTIQEMNKFIMKPSHEPYGSMMQSTGYYAPTQYMNTNLSQYHRKMQEITAAELRVPMHNLLAHLYNFCELKGAKFSLRPMMALPGPHQEAIRGLSQLVGIQLPDMYLTAAQEEARRTFEEYGFTEFNPNRLGVFTHLTELEEDMPDAIWNHKEWDYWDRRAAHAIIRFDDNMEWAIAPNLLIPPLYVEPRTRLPMFDSLPQHVGLLEELGYSVDLMPEAIVNRELDSANPPGFTERLGERELILEIMAAVCFYATLLASKVRLGRGHHKPSWTTTPLNAPVCQYWRLRIAYLNHKVTEDAL